MLQSEVERIEPRSVVLKTGDGLRQVVNNSVIVSAGGILPSDFLRAVGIEVDTKYGTA
jgi:thioredoxin reductase (NADPH)